MLDVAWPELVVIGAVALVVIGPKDLPKAMHALGSLVGKARRMFHILGSQLDQLSYEAEMMETLKKKRESQENQAKPSPETPPDPKDRGTSP